MTPMVTKVSITPFETVVAKCFIKMTERGAAMSAPPPNPMMAMPVAMPGRSGNHLMSVDTGDI